MNKKLIVLSYKGQFCKHRYVGYMAKDDINKLAIAFFGFMSDDIEIEYF